jgi:hypothetical protein
MRPPTSGLPRRARLLRAQLLRRAAQRGATVYIVLLVIAMLTGVGLFAAKSATLATRGGGFLRQMTQTHYVAEYGFQTVLQEMSTDRRSIYLSKMSQPGEMSADCDHDPVPGDNIVPVGHPLVQNYTCFRFGYQYLESIVDRETIPDGDAFPAILDESVLGASVGSLGYGELVGNMQVELTDLAPTEKPVPGMDATGSSGVRMRFYTVSMGVAGQVRHDSADTEVAETSVSAEYARGSMMVGPLPTL